MLLPDFRVSWELQCNVILHFNTSCTWEQFYLQCMQLNVFISFLWLFDVIWIYIKDQNFKKWENEGDLNLFLNVPNFMRNGIIISMLLVMAFFKVTYQKVYLSVNIRASVNIIALAKVSILTVEIFPAWSFNKFFNFFKPEYFISGVLWKGSDLYFRDFDTIWIYIKNQN